MKFDQTSILVGVVGKKGNGVLDNGQQWVTDRVELHVLAPFSEANTMAHGQTVMQYNVEDYLANYDKAKALIDQQVTLHMEITAATKLGAAGKIICLGFSPVKPEQKQQPRPQAAVNS